MAVSTNPRICSHIKVNGVRCGSPALRGEIFCYFHQRMIRGVRTPPRSRIHPMAMLEDEASIQASLMETINAIVRNQIDVNRARLVLRALHIATEMPAAPTLGPTTPRWLPKFPNTQPRPKSIRPIPCSAKRPCSGSSTSPSRAFQATSDLPANKPSNGGTLQTNQIPHATWMRQTRM